MNKHSIQITLLALATVLTVSLQLGYAQAPNLLSNPGFEEAFTNQGGTPSRQVASSWTAWHETAAPGAPNYENTQPEYEEGSTSRVRSGSNSQHYFSFYATHTGGVYQTVSGVTSGSEYAFNMYVYVWSSNSGDLNVSADDGDVLVQVGIDPTGGIDPSSDDILWSVAREEYDTFGLHSITALSESSSITVFVKSQVGFPVANSSVYLDDASLALVTEGDTLDVATETPTVTPTSSQTPSPTQTVQPTQTPTQAPTVFATPTSEDEIVVSDTPSPSAISSATFTPTTIPTESPISETFPGTIVHTVRQGDTISQIAALYGSSIVAIQQANQLPNANAIIGIGDALIVPVALIVVTSTPTSAVAITSTPTSAVAITSTPTTVSATATPANNPQGEIIQYTVQAGDTLSGIARRFNTSVAAVAQLNGIVNPDRVLLGQTLQIPSAQVESAATPLPQSPVSTPQETPTLQTYVVLPGDNLYRLSLRFNVTLAELVEENGLANPNLIQVGETLRIP